VAVDEHERDRAILDAAARLLLGSGYDKLTMGDVADAVDLHRGLVYLRFASKDELVAAVVARELDRYALAWREHFEADPRAGSVASIARAMLAALTALPLASAVVAEDEEVFGRYLRKDASYFRRRSEPRTREVLEALQAAGVVRREVDTRATAFVLDALAPAVRRCFLRAGDADQPSREQVLETLTDMLDRTLTPAGADLGAELAAGRAILLGGLEEARAGFTVRGDRPADRDSA
jgi:AcrR family transcriptional regulator